MKKIISKFKEFENELNSSQKLIMYIILVFLLILAVNMISKLSFGSNNIDYRQIENDILSQKYEVTKDREIYMKIGFIIDEINKINRDEYEIDGKKVSINDLYKYAKFSEYQISKSKFKKNISKAFGNIQTNEIEYSIIKNIYNYSSEQGMYIVEIETAENNKNYIGINLKENNFYIFYLK